MTFAVEVVVVLKPVVNDPQGLVVRDGLHRLGFPEVRAVRVGKHLELEVEGHDEASVRAQVEAMCDQLLRNTVIEDSRIEAVSVLSGNAL
jgi:phosphoribosylformylglycinamidine synthase